MNNSFDFFYIGTNLISPEIHGLVVFLSFKVFVRIGQLNLYALLIISNKRCVNIDVNIAEYVIKIGRAKHFIESRQSASYVMWKCKICKMKNM